MHAGQPATYRFLILSTREIVANQSLVVLTYPSIALLATITQYSVVRTVGLCPVSVNDRLST